MKRDRSCAIKTGHFHVLTTELIADSGNAVGESEPRSIYRLVETVPSDMVARVGQRRSACYGTPESFPRSGASTKGRMNRAGFDLVT